jgi:hypothetical protein
MSSKQGGKKFYEKQRLEKPGKIFVLSAHEFQIRSYFDNKDKLPGRR